MAISIAVSEYVQRSDLGQYLTLRVDIIVSTLKLLHKGYQDGDLNGVIEVSPNVIGRSIFDR